MVMRPTGSLCGAANALLLLSAEPRLQRHRKTLDSARAHCTFHGLAEVTVKVAPDEAVVLFELLHRCEDAGWYETADLLPGERTALRALSGRLENLVVEPFDNQYSEFVDQARERLRERGGA
jgi:hypothetical protein